MTKCVNLSTLLAMAKKIVSTLLHKIHCFFIPLGLAHITLPSLGWTTGCKNSGLCKHCKKRQPTAHSANQTRDSVCKHFPYMQLRYTVNAHLSAKLYITYLEQPFFSWLICILWFLRSPYKVQWRNTLTQLISCALQQVKIVYPRLLSLPSFSSLLDCNLENQKSRQ